VGEPVALVRPMAMPTGHRVLALLTAAEVQYLFVDLPGLLDPSFLLQERMRALALQGLDQAHLVLHLHPASEAPAPELVQLAGLERRPEAPILLVYTKADLVSAEQVEQLERTALVVSAETGHGLDRLLHEIKERLPAAEFGYPADDLGVQPTRFFVVEYLREAAFHLLEDELPYAVTAEVEEFREASDPVYIRATLFVERESQKRILIGAKGRTIRAVGQHARQRLETLLGSRVFLETWVKVLPRWRQDSALLDRFGFPNLTAGD
jgi:GTP-binding protein Era